MRLLDLKLTNFRQYYGEQEIVFAHGDANRNITVIHGYNGSGKTALLNAFVWCLYGETTKDLEAPERLANERTIGEAAAGAQVRVAVRLRFRTHGETYLAERVVMARKDADGTARQGEPKLTLWRIATSGESEELGGPQQYLNRILPPDLYPFFFFNGERVEALASPEAYTRVEEGVKTLLDVEIYERSVRHLQEWVLTELARELRQYGDEETQAAVDEEAGLKQKEAASKEAIALLKANLAAVTAEIEKIEQKQSELEAIRELTGKRNSVRAELGQIESRLADTREDQARHFSESGYLAFVDDVFTKTEALVGAARQRGDLPAKVKPQFVDDLLANGTCICGRDLATGSAEVAKLRKWREVTGLAELEDVISQTNGALGELRARRSRYFDEIDRAQTRTGELLAGKRRLADELDFLNAKIGDRDHGEEVAELEQRRQAQQRKHEDLRVDLRRAEEELSELEDKLRDATKRIERLNVQEAKAKVVQQQRLAVAHIADALKEIYDIQKQDVRRDLSESISEIWKDAAIKDYRAAVTEDFRLELTKSVAGITQPVHGASTGEKQVLSLSFVGSLVRKAKRNEERSQQDAGGRELIVGGEYPLVMDSPFGALEDDYRRKVAEWVPSLAGQVIVMASKTQWRDEVEFAMRPRIGREYILELHTPKENADRTIELRGHEYTYVQTSDAAIEQTLIQEVQ